MSPNASASVKLLAAFVVVTAAALMMASALHSSGTLAAADHSTGESVALIPADGERPVRETQPLPKAIPVPASAVLLAKLEPALTLPSTEKAVLPPPPVSRPVSLLTPLLRPDIQHFEELLEENLTKELPRALPLPLVYQAVLMQDDEFLRGLLVSGFDPDETTSEGDTALCAAARASRESALQLLLAHGASPEIAGREGQKPVALAALKRNRTILQALLSAGADANTKFATPVDEELLKTVMVDDLRRHLRADRGVTILMACAARGDVENAVLLMKYSASTEANTKRFNRYALDFAAEQSYLFLMRVLLGRSADSEPDLLVTVDLSKQRAWIARQGKIIDSTSVSTGRDGYDTPAGRYVVTDKHRDWTSTLYKASMPWFMRLNCGAIGLHAGYVTGRPASHGCIRLPPEKAREWFKIVGVGDEVQIVE